MSDNDMKVGQDMLKEGVHHQEPRVGEGTRAHAQSQAKSGDPSLELVWVPVRDASLFAAKVTGWGLDLEGK